MQKWQCVLLLALCLGTVRGFVSEDEVEDNLQLLFGSEDGEGPTQTGLLSALQEFDLSLNGVAEGPQSFTLPGGAPKGCDQCLMGGIRTVMQKVGQKLRDFCEKTTCPKIKEMCIRAAAHKELTLGFLIYKVRPISHGFAYCFGSASCDEKSAKDTSVNAANILIDALNLTKSGGSGGAFDFVSGTQHFLSSLDLSRVQTDFETHGDWVPIENRRELRRDTEEEGCRDAGGCHHRDHTHHHGKNDGHNCDKCVKTTLGYLMKHVTKETISFCTKNSSKNAKIKQWCRAGENNPKHAFGALLGAVAPWKFSSGYCIGKGYCKTYHGGSGSSGTTSLLS